MFLRTLALASLLTLAASARRPNVVFILCDDLGYGDLGVLYQNSRNGSKKFGTPKLDAMAAQGAQLRAHYTAAPVCAPARASLLTGVHQGHSNVRNNQFDKALENNHTLATVLKEAGYATAIVGKWGLQGGGGSPAAWPAYPTKRGFDYFYGYVRHGDGHTQYPFHTTVDPDGSGDVVRPPKEVYDQNSMVRDDLAKCYTTDLFTARAKKWIIDHRSASPAQPFFLYLAYSAPHAALQVPTVAYPAGGGVTGGLQWTGSPGAMINTATGTIDSFIHPDYAPLPWTANEKRFATMVRRIDDCVGDLLQTLDDLGIGKETLVVVTSDNGPHHESYFNAAYGPDSFHSFGPFDGTKRDCWEGGIREPTLAWWPGTIPAGRVSNRPSQFHDWLPTFCEIAETTPPARSDGVSLVSDLTGTGVSKDATVYIEYFNNGSTKDYGAFDQSHRGRTRNEMQVIFHGGFKGVRYNVRAHADPFEIYDLTKDPGETSNLAAGKPAIQQEMKDRVLRLRRPDSSSASPYDSGFVPGTSAPVSSGVQWASYQGPFPWVPDFSSLTPVATGTCAGITPAVGPGGEDFGLRFDGYLLIPADGDYTFHLPSSGGSHLRIHEATVIDDDLGRSGAEPSGSIRLRAGLHPFRLSFRHATGAAAVALEWSGPGIARQAVPAANFRRFDANSTTPPTSADDRAATSQNSTVSVPVQPLAAQHAPKPLFIDPHYHGSCDPEVVWNEESGEAWIYYTSRRSTRGRASYVGTPIGVASSKNLVDWEFRGYAAFDGVPGKKDMPVTFWAPGVIRRGDVWHMFVTYKDNARPPWGGNGTIRHYTAPVSDPLNGWKPAGVPDFPQPDPIDVTLIEVDGKVRAYYRVGNGGGIQWSETEDLKSWIHHGKCPGDINRSGIGYQEAPYVFRFGGAFWMLTDPHKGLSVYRSDDAVTWKAHTTILKQPGTGLQDGTFGRHPSVLVKDDRAFLFYHVEPNRPYPSPPPEKRSVEMKKSVLQVAELRIVDGKLVCERDAPVNP
jgi:uncharacterized sulfatase